MSSKVYHLKFRFILNMTNNKDIITYQSIFHIGIVLSVSGREVKVKVDKQKNLPHIIFNGTLIKNISVGGYLKELGLVD